MNRNVRKALDIALDAEHPRRFHHELARTGYSDGGLPSIADMAHDVPYLPKGDTSSPLSIAKVQPYTAAGIEPPASSLAPTTTKIGHPKKLSIKAPKAGKVRLRKPKAMKPRKLRFDKGGPAIEDALNLASKTMSNMAKETQDMDMPMRGESMSQGSTSTIVKEKVPGKRAHMIYERHEQTPPEHHMFESDLHPDVVDALRLARATGGRDRGIIEPYTYNEYGDFRGRDANQWRTERGKKGRKKNYNPWSDPENMYTHPTEQRHDPEDPMYYISPEEYREGTPGKGVYALANGGRAHLAVGGNPIAGTNPALDPTAALNPALTPAVGPMTVANPAPGLPPMAAANPVLGLGAATPANPAGAATPAVPLITPTTNIGTGAPTIPQTAPGQPATAPAVQAPVSALPDPYQSYVNSLYQNILGRSAEESGQQYWTDQLASGQMSEGDVLKQFAGSQEFQSLYKTDPAKAITALYQEAMNRAPDQGGLNYWQQQAQQGLELPTMVNNFLQSQEGQAVSNIRQMYQNYTGAIPTNDQLAQAGQMLASGKSMGDVEQAIANSPESNKYYVNQAFQDILGRAPDESGLKYWTDQLNSGQTTPDQFYDAMVNSPEADAYANSQFVTDEYQGLLGRDPTQDELKSAMDQLNSGKISQADFDTSLSNSEASQQYQASNFSPYQVAQAGDGVTPPPNQPRTQFQVDAFLNALPGQIADMGKAALNMAMDELGIRNPAERNAMAANVQVETGFGKGVETNYSGTSNARIKSLFSAAKKLSDAELTKLKQDPRAFFNYIYGNKNGNQGGDDGYNYRGRGAVQLTGRGNYEKYGQLAGLGNQLVENPDLMLDPIIGAKVSVAYMKDMAEHHPGRNVFDKITRGVNAHGPTVARKRVAYSKLGANSPFSRYTGDVQFAGGNAAISGAPTDPALAQALAQSGAGGNVAGSGMFNPSGGPIGGPTFDPNAAGGFTSTQQWMPQNAFTVPGTNGTQSMFDQLQNNANLNYLYANQNALGAMGLPTYNNSASSFTGAGFAPAGVTGYSAPLATGFTGSVAFGPGFRDGGSVGTRSRVQRALEMLRPEDDDIEAALRLARGRRA